jgi:DNA-directed RNA polymerase specialized sigma24 family protein
VSILNELSKKDSLWREIALNITMGDSMMADEITQLMYLKIMNYKRFNIGFVARALKHIYIDILRKNKTVSLDSMYYLEDTTNVFEPTDKENEYLDKTDSLKWYQKELLSESYDRSIREIASIYNINYGFVHREIHKALKQVLGDDYKMYNNSNLKYKKC